MLAVCCDVSNPLCLPMNQIVYEIDSKIQIQRATRWFTDPPAVAALLPRHMRSSLLLSREYAKVLFPLSRRPRRRATTHI